MRDEHFHLRVDAADKALVRCAAREAGISASRFILEAAGVVGLRAVVATARGEEARSFFAKQGFAPFPEDRYRFHFPLRPRGERV